MYSVYKWLLRNVAKPGLSGRNNSNKLVFWAVILLLVTLVSCLARVEAKLMVPDPDYMLREAEIILTGVVIEIKPGREASEGVTGTVEVREVLKGSLKDKYVTLSETRYRVTGAWLQRIPPKGTHVFVLLRRDETGKPNFFVDGNQVAVIRNGRVEEIYKGINTERLPYVEKYDEYYQKNRKRDVAANPPAGPGVKDTSSAHSYPVPQKMYVVSVGRDGVLGWIHDSQNRDTGCAGFSCNLYRSPAPGERFEPVDVFSQVNGVFSGLCSHGIQNTTGLLTFVWAKKQKDKKFALYVSADAGRTWRKVPGTEGENPCCPYVMVPDLVSPRRAYLLPTVPATPFLGEQPLSLHSFFETKDGGVSWEKKSLPGKTPPAVEGLLFHPEDPEKIWAWRSSMGDWTGVQYSEDGGVSWRFLEVLGDNRIYGAVFNPFTDELLVAGRQVVSRWYNGKGENLRDKCGLQGKDFVAGPPLLDPKRKNVIIPVFSHEEKGATSGEVYWFRDGKLGKIASFSVEQGSPVYSFLYDRKLYISFMNLKGPGHLLEFPLPVRSIPWLWPGLGGALALGIVLALYVHKTSTRPSGRSEH
ncbi:MAG: hypothetical protein AB1510_06770 [Bacillota bacterium]